MKVYIDADILIWHLRGESNALKFLKSFKKNSNYELCIGAMQRAEIVFFMRPDEEDATHLFLSQFKTLPVDRHIIDLAGSMYRTWYPSHGIDINDAILAATAMQTGGTIFSLNAKHYPMRDINVKQAWKIRK